jgi:hypothetical protein
MNRAILIVLVATAVWAVVVLLLLGDSLMRTIWP